MKPRLLTAIAMATLTLGSPHTYAQYPGAERAANLEIARLQKMKEYAEQSIQKASQAMMDKDYESAFAYYKSAVDVLPSSNAGETGPTRQAALDGFSRAAVKLAEQRISEGRWQDAETTVQIVLEEQYNPTYAPAQKLASDLKDPERFNKTTTPNFVAKIEEAKQLLREADGLYESGRFDQAFQKYEQVLNIDRYNIAARRGMEKVNQARSQYAAEAYSETRGAMITEVESGWELPIKRYDLGTSAIIEQPTIDTRGTAAISRKLDQIIIPSIEFRDATIREAIDFLRMRAAALDTTESDPTRKGVNIVLKLDSSYDDVDSAVRITLALRDLPLRAALEYVARAANLKLKIEPYAVAIVPLSDQSDLLITKEYSVPPSFIQSLPGGATDLSQPGVAAGSQSTIARRASAKEYLESNGVQFPPGATAQYIPTTSKLIVKNTQQNLDIVDSLVEIQMSTPPTQIEIESKFLEVTQNDLRELGFDWLLGDFAMPFGTGVYGGGGTPGFGQNVQGTIVEGGAIAPGNSAFPFVNPGSSVPVGANSLTSGPITAGNRNGSMAIRANAVDALLFGAGAGAAPATLALAGVFTNPQFQVVMRAINQSKGVDLVSSPKVTTKSGQQATIEIIREFRYPSEYELAQVSSIPAGNTFTPVAPTSPTEFETRNTGVILNVTPTVGDDGFTIDMEIKPQVVEFEGFINYGSPIFSTVTASGTGVSSRVLLTENTINRPVFGVREVDTSVTIYDGQTVALGGLLREDVQKVQDKVPIIGDIPLVGRLFRSDADQHIKRNLIIFVTAALMDPSGQPLAKESAEDPNVLLPDTQTIQNEVIAGDPLSAQP